MYVSIYIDYICMYICMYEGKINLFVSHIKYEFFYSTLSFTQNDHQE